MNFASFKESNFIQDMKILWRLQINKRLPLMSTSWYEMHTHTYEALARVLSAIQVGVWLA